MTEEETEREKDEEAKRLILAAWTTEPRPGQRERVLAAISAAAEKRAREAEGAEGAAEATKPAQSARRVWQAVAMMVIALAAVAVAAMYYRGHVHRVAAPGVEPDGHFAAPVPPHRGP